MATAAAPQDTAVNDLVDTCKSIAERNSGDEAWFWLQSHRAQITRELWSDSGVRALRAKLGGTADPLERNCLERALREAQRGQIEND